MIATIATSVERPTLDVENRARRRCRNNLIGLRVRDRTGDTWTIGATDWRPGTVLVVSPTLMAGPWVPASDLTLVDRWPFACCRGKLEADGSPRKRRATR